MSSTDALSKEEAQLYDRQLRLWGVQSQQRLQQSKIAIFGLNGAQSEIAKNLILAGLNEITLFDWVIVTAQNTVPHLFLDPTASIGQNRGTASKARLSELNPLVRVTAVESSSIEEGVEQLKIALATQGFDVVIASDVSTLQLCTLNEICRSASPPSRHLLQSPNHPNLSRTVPFVAVQTFGMFGFCFMDLGNHIYTREITDANGNKTYSTGLQVHNSLASAFQHDTSKSSPDALFFSLLALHLTEQQIQSKANSSALGLIKSERDQFVAAGKVKEARFPVSLVENLVTFYGVEVAPICAILGGLVGQETIKVLSASAPPPLNNFFFYNATSGASSVLQASNVQE